MKLNRIPWASAPMMAAAMLATAPVLAAQGELLDIAWSADGGFGRDLRVAPKQFVEVCGRLSAGTAVAWRFDSGTKLDFNIHFHEGTAVRYPTRRPYVAKAAGTLHARVDQDYCWMWTNPTAGEAALTFMLHKQ